VKPVKTEGAWDVWRREALLFKTRGSLGTEDVALVGAEHESGRGGNQAGCDQLGLK